MEHQFNKRAASDMLDTIKGFIQDNPATVAGILGAGGIGAIGGAMNVGQGEEGETAKDRVLRRVKNALIGGALGAGSAAAIGTGLKYLYNDADNKPATPGPSANESIVLPSPSKDKPKGEDAPVGGSVIPGVLTTAGTTGAGALGGAKAYDWLYKGFTGRPSNSNAALETLTGGSNSLFKSVAGKGKSPAAMEHSIENIMTDLLSGNRSRMAANKELLSAFGSFNDVPLGANGGVLQESGEDYMKRILRSKFTGSNLEELTNAVSTHNLRKALFRDPNLAGAFSKTRKAKLNGLAALRHLKRKGKLGAILAGASLGASAIPMLNSYIED